MTARRDGYASVLRDIVAERTGASLDGTGVNLSIARFVSGRVAELGLDSEAGYVELLSSSTADDTEFSRLVDAVTNPQTWFFRESEQLTAVAHIDGRRTKSAGDPLRIWCAACASGEEAYSLAISCHQMGLPCEIVATDINTRALEAARGGDYREWSMRKVSTDIRNRYFEQSGSRFRVADEVRNSITFLQHNFMDPHYPRPTGSTRGWDIVFCRNVLIYFTSDAIRSTVLGLISVLAPNGWIFVSSGDGLNRFDLPLRPERLGKTIGYRLESAITLRRPRWTPLATEPGDMAEADSETRPRLQRRAPSTPVAAPRPGANEPSADAMYGEATTLLQRDNPEGAHAQLERTLALYPEHVPARITLGNLLLRAHHFERALETYAKAQSHNPLLAETHYLRGVIYRKLHELENAAAALRQALFLDPGFWPASFLLAGVYERLGRNEHRLNNLQHTITALDRADQPALFTSSVAGLKDAQLDPAQVRSACERALTSKSHGLLGRNEGRS